MTEPLVVLFEDRHCLAVVKPAGLLTQGTAAGEPTLEAEVRRYLDPAHPKRLTSGRCTGSTGPSPGLSSGRRRRKPRAAWRSSSPAARHARNTGRSSKRRDRGRSPTRTKMRSGTTGWPPPTPPEWSGRLPQRRWGHGGRPPGSGAVRVRGCRRRRPGSASGPRRVGRTSSALKPQVVAAPSWVIVLTGPAARFPAALPCMLAR